MKLETLDDRRAVLVEIAIKEKIERNHKRLKNLSMFSAHWMKVRSENSYLYKVLLEIEESK